jgi:Na+/phosphate symporter
MIHNDLDLQIDQVRQDITAATREIVRLRDMSERLTAKLFQLIAEREEQSRLKTVVLDDGIEMGVRGWN